MSGSPTASRRSGTAYSCLSTRRLIRDASANRTTASVASASVRTVPCVSDGLIWSSTSGPINSPMSRKAIAGVSHVSVIRPESPATTSRAAAMIASSHFIDRAA